MAGIDDSYDEVHLSQPKGLLDPSSTNTAMTRQTIKLNGNDGDNSFSVYGRQVRIEGSNVTESVEGSNKVKINPVVSFDWEVKHYRGQQVAVDKEHKYVAYCLKGRSGGIVRLIHRKLAERALIKGYQGLVVDLTFALTRNDILASLDECGTLYVHEISLDTDKRVVPALLLQLSWAVDKSVSKRVIWCKYLPEGSTSGDEEDDDECSNSMLVSVTIHNVTYVLNVTQLIEEHGAGPLQYDDVKQSITEINASAERVVDSAFSPDGSAIATASEDGNARFFNVDLSRPASPRCLYEWSPHEGRPLSFLCFLDNHKEPDPNAQFWKYAITGADNNTELKLWSCENWQCVQTIRFTADADSDQPPCLIAATDLSSRYLIMSDINHRVMYVLKIHQDKSIPAAHVSSISEFVLGAPCLSFAVMSVKYKNPRNQNDEEDEDELTNGTSSTNISAKPMVCVHLQAVQPKHLQDMQISFVPVTSTLQTSLQTLSTESADNPLMKDDLSDVSKAAETPSSSFSAPTSNSSSVLLTPDAFTSSPKKPIDLASPHDSAHSSLTQVTNIADNTSLAMTTAFEAGTASTVSSMTLTPKSSVNDAPVSLSPPSMPRPPVTPGEESATLTKSPNNDLETARQLDDLFSSIVKEGDQTAETNMLPADFVIEEDILTQPETNSMTDESSAYDQNIWPKPPAPPLIPQREAPTDTDASDTTDDSRSDQESSEEKPSSEELNVKEIERDVVEEMTDLGNTRVLSASVLPQPQFMQNKFTEHTGMLEELKLAVLSLTQLVSQQSSDIQALKLSRSTEEGMSKVMKQVQQANSAISNKMENSLASIKKEQRTSQERWLSQSSQKISADLKQTISNEVKKSLVPSLQQLIDPVKKDLHNVMAEKLTAADVTLKESISRLVNSPQTIDKIGHTVGLAVQNVMAASHHDCLKQVLLPSYDASTRAMFQQINKAFQDGTNTYLRQLEDHATKLQSKQLNVQDVIASRCDTAVQSLEKASSNVAGAVTLAIQEQIAEQVRHAVKSLEVELVREVRLVVQQEIGSALTNQQIQISEQLTALRSNAATPALDSQLTGTDIIKAQINQYLSLKDYDSAFQHALTASDLSIVVFLLRSIRDSNEVFTEPCPLKQATLLSLVQQLSFGLTGSNISLKLSYLADSINNLDPCDSVTSQHMMSIINTVNEKLKEFNVKNPKSAEKRMIQAIEMSIKTLLKFASRNM